MTGQTARLLAILLATWLAAPLISRWYAEWFASASSASDTTWEAEEKWVRTVKWMIRIVVVIVAIGVLAESLAAA